MNVILCDNPIKLIGASVLLLNGLLGFQVVKGAEVEISSLEEIASTELGSGFSLVNAAESGVNFVNRLDAELAIQNQILLNGSGVAVGDIDGDDLPDIYLCSLNGPNRLFRNKGRWQFEDITGKSKGIACEDQASFGAAMADMDGDGALDLLVTGLNSGVRYFENNRSGRFSEKTDRVGLRSNDGSASLAIADVNGDSFLDLYVVNYRNETLRDSPDQDFEVDVSGSRVRLISFNGRPANHPELDGRFEFDRDGTVLENGQLDRLYLNQGGDFFKKVNWGEGLFRDEQGQPVTPPYDWGLSALFRDLDGDGLMDLYVCNDFQSPDRIWMGAGDGTFRLISSNAVRQTSLFSMGVDVADVNGDGREDIFVVDMLSRDRDRRMVQVMDEAAFSQFRGIDAKRPQTPRNTFFLGLGQSQFAEMAHVAGVEASEWSWCPLFSDIDLDGDMDLLITTGHWRDAQNVDVARAIESRVKAERLTASEAIDARRDFPKLETPNVAFRNNGDLTFTEVGMEWGFDENQVSQGMAQADLDQDGDLDLVVNVLNGPPLLYMNLATEARIAVKLRGKGGNQRGIGATLQLDSPGLPLQRRQLIAGGRYLSSDQPMASFAAKSEMPATLRLRWPSGAEDSILNVPANSLVVVSETEGEERESSSPKKPKPLFEDVSDKLNHQHYDLGYDDFSLQPGIPKKLSSSGPGVTWFDFNGDGWDDLLLGAGRGGKLGVYRNDRRGNFVKQKANLFSKPAAQDFTTLLGWRYGEQRRSILYGVSGYEFGGVDAPAVYELSLVDGGLNEKLRRPGGIGAMALADIDQDGDLDLYVAGRATPGRYPTSPPSAILLSDGATLDTEPDLTSDVVGLEAVVACAWVDLDRDALPELVTLSEWGAMRAFERIEGRFRERVLRFRKKNSDGYETRSLSELTGLWRSLAVGDFDADGRFDLVLGNWGLNSDLRASIDEPHQIYRRTEGGPPAFLEGHVVGATAYPKFPLSTFLKAFPEEVNGFSSFASFAQVDMEEIMERVRMLSLAAEVSELRSLVLLNRGDYFQCEFLPMEAQLAPVNGIVATDFDLDGFTDLFIGQNEFQLAPVRSPLGSGRGWLLRGQGDGRFEPLSMEASGIDIQGEMQGAAGGDYDRDGRWDLVVGVYQGRTRLFHGVGNKSGCLLRIIGGPRNPDAIGASIRLIRGGQYFGSRLLIQNGSSLLSANSVRPLVPTGDTSKVEVVWPDGLSRRFNLPEGLTELVVRRPR